MGVRRAGYAPDTVKRISRQVRRFSAECGTGPWDVNGDQVEAWLQGLACRSEATRYTYRTSLRTFYRWAHRVGRVLVDPTEEVSHRLQARQVGGDWGLAIGEYLHHLRAAGKPSTTVQLRLHQLNRLAVGIGVRDPWAVSTDELARWLSRHRWAQETMRSHRAALRGFYAWATETGRVEVDPARRLPVVRAAHPAPRPAAEDAYAAALRAAGEREGLMLRLAAEAGLRRGEVARVHSADLIDQEDGPWLQVWGKGGRQRLVPLSGELGALVRAAGPGWVFPGAVEGHLSAARVGELVSALLPPGCTMHALRHRFATRAYSRDRDVLAVQQLLGHSRPDTTQRYVQVPRASLRRLVQ